MLVKNTDAYFDYLTGLYNRLYLFENFSENINEFIVVFLDIDDFKYINDTYGYEIGDEFLKKFVRRLSKIVGNRGKVFSYNADKFLVLFPKENFKDIYEKVELLFQKLKEIIIVGDIEIACSISIGIYITEKDDKIDDAIKKAEIAMQEAKQKVKGQYVFYKHQIEKEKMRKANILTELKKSILRNELYILYQPILSVKGNKIQEVEALLRWNNEKLGEVSPVEFIPIAEETGFIREMGFWVIEEVCRQIKEWEKKNLDLKVAINISPNQFKDKMFFENYKYIVKNNNVKFSKIKFEITETQIFKTEEKTVENLLEIMKLGTKISLDDFGAGYSSMKNMILIPCSEIKIDKIFIDYITKDTKIQNLIASIIHTAHRLGYDVIAEGVEYKEQYDKLLEYDCEKIQGYFISRPIGEKDIIKFIKRRSS
ncbi:diguanylate cyclase (GGDEF) domain-containing protein [Caminicella sporogenes DSM 14501]|uniref:Diguanylate cyclase (GGDEF) domain-containing protein n=1 Tax=Caminicella sporogenes DSM 14501 TaxID=1121266 RepID=A0A1M6P4A2_9FIRM|nr:bifunctional diguanylate cyclase/phosphodiesterase [Caminicella sporogenes]SHK02805.1 diguanylate cyclase (GGDEF) domain-containing protein [Caminicella sporogenes DSM 14501]